MRLVLACLFAVSAAPLAAHEFWISPEDYTVEPNGRIVAALRVGETFEGPSYPYIPSNFERFSLVNGADERTVDGRVGDLPALSVEPPAPGLWIVVHETDDKFLRYDEWDTFVRFVTHKDFPGALDAHAARDLPEDGFRERYRRFAKSLVAVGDGMGADREVGLRTEIVAEANPYIDDLSGQVPVRVLFEGAPRADAQVEVFARDPDGAVTVTTTRTDVDGRARIDVAPGHEYLVDAVVLRPLQPADEDDPVWESLWASLTFAVPGG